MQLYKKNYINQSFLNVPIFQKMSDEETSSQTPTKHKLEREFWNKVTTGEWKVRAVTIGGIFKAGYYNILRLVFDKKNNRVYNWYVCSRCRMAIYHNLSEKGSKRLKKHPCYIDYLREKRDNEFEQSEVLDPVVEPPEIGDDDQMIERDIDGNLVLPSFVLDEVDENKNPNDESEIEDNFNDADTDTNVVNADRFLSQLSIELSHDKQ